MTGAGDIGKQKPPVKEKYTSSLNQSLAKDRGASGDSGGIPYFSVVACIFFRNFASFYYTSFYTFSILYPMPICVWIYCGESGSDSSFLRSVAIKTRSEATSLSQELPQTSWVI